MGAGLAGATAVKSALEEGLEVTCFEQDHQIGKHTTEYYTSVCNFFELQTGD